MSETKDYNKLFEDAKVIVASEEGIANDNIKKAFGEIRRAFDEYRKGFDTLQNDNKTLKIGVVGQVKAGKSSFLNSLFFDGENVLPRASTPMTAGLTVLEYGDKNEFAVEYYNSQEWHSFTDMSAEYDTFVSNYKEGYPGLTDEEAVKSANIPKELCAAKELVRQCGKAAESKITKTSKVETQSFNSIIDLQNILEQYVGVNGKFTSVVKSLNISLHDERLKDLRIVDTPGVNDPVVSREMRTREFLRSCHGVFFLSSSTRFFDSTDVSFLSGRIGSQGISKIVLIASKFDSVLQELSVTQNFPDDLEGAIDDCGRQLMSQFHRNMVNADYNGDEPIFTESSGIGFSIAKKPEDKWDSEERNVVSLMQRYYPSNFSTDAELRETFMDLSNIDEIRKNYLEGVFVKNRDRIIRDKTDAYFSNMGKNLGGVLKDKREDLQSTLKVLETSDISQLESIKATTLKIIDNIAKNVDSIAARCDAIAERALKNCWNSFSVPGHIPMTTISGTFTRKSTIIGWSKSFSCSYRFVDRAKLAEELGREFENAGKNLTDKWSEETEVLNKSIMEVVADIIHDSETKDESVDADSLRRMLKEIIDSMKSESTLNYRDAVDQALTKINAIAQGARIKTTLEESMSEAKAESTICNRANDKDQEVRTKVSTEIDAFKQTMRTALEKSKKDVIEVFRSRKQELIDKANESVKANLEQLEIDLNNKKEQMQAYKVGIANIKKMEQLL
ncbi:MAG: dynamin family protein [Prevotella sp.]|nr:dynamin family protein [Bacteroidales bacterium]MDY4955942.1 dynamin family protein [Prevotella sp.]